MTIIRIGLDTAKHVFQVHGVDESEQPVLRRQLRRSEMEKFFGKLAPTRIGLEACGASHHWARVLRGLGHEVVLLPPQYIKPYVKRGKNDAIDAAAICEAMSRPGMRFVPVKSAEQQAALMLLKVRDLLVKQRTMLINAIRGHAAEFGVIAAKGPVKVAELVQRAHAEEAGVPALAREMLSLLVGPARCARLQAQGPRDPADGVAQGRPGEPMPGDPARHRSDRRDQLCPQGERPQGLPLGPPLRRLARPDAARELDRRATPAGPDQPAGRCGLRKLLVLGATAVIRFARAGKTSPWLAQSAGAAAEKARRRGAGQQDGPDPLGHDGERRTLSPAAAGLSRSPPYHLALARKAARWRSVEPRIGTLRGTL